MTPRDRFRPGTPGSLLCATADMIIANITRMTPATIWLFFPKEPRTNSMANFWFSADFHFGHSNIIRCCDRPFASAAEMDEAILDRVNSSVKADDELYFLGDFCIGGPKVAVAYRQKIRCKKVYFILGNHDRAIKKIVNQFVWIKEMADVNVRNQPIVLCH